MPSPAFVDGLGAFADRYGGFIVDQWGVIHDGTVIYAGAVEVLAELKRRGRRIVLLSNSGRRAEANRARLRELGLPLALVDGVVTSGEAAWQAMRERRAPPFDALGRRCYLITRGGDQEVLSGLDAEIVGDVSSADFLLLSGVDSMHKTVAELEPMLRAAADRRLPAICSNPDLVAVAPHGLELAPGSLAQCYEQLGGEVTYVGKPHAPIYAACLDLLGGLAPAAICCVGDSIEHDIAGANRIGAGAAFITGGIHAAEFPPDATPAMRTQAMQRLIRKHAATPDWVIPGLVW